MGFSGLGIGIPPIPPDLICGAGLFFWAKDGNIYQDVNGINFLDVVGGFKYYRGNQTLDATCFITQINTHNAVRCTGNFTIPFGANHGSCPHTFTWGGILKTEIWVGYKNIWSCGFTQGAYTIFQENNNVDKKLHFRVRQNPLTQTTMNSIQDFTGEGHKVVICTYREADNILRLYESGNMQEDTFTGVINYAVSTFSVLNQDIRADLGEFFICPSFCDKATANLFGQYLSYRAGIAWIDIP